MLSPWFDKKHNMETDSFLLTVNPNADSVTSENLSALWTLEWTTEREILFLMENGLPGQPSGPVRQKIDVDAKTLSNIMLFGKDSLFEVASTIDPEVSITRSISTIVVACPMPHALIE